MWVHAGYFACVGAHAAGGLARFDVAPDHGSHVALIVHEAGVEVGGIVGVGGLDVGEAAGEWIFLGMLLGDLLERLMHWEGKMAYQEVEHGEEFARGHEHVVAEPAVIC